MKNKNHAGNIWKVIIFIYLVVPVLVTFVYSFADRWNHILPEGFTLEYYIQALTNQKFLFGIARGILIALVPVVMTNLTVLLTLYVVLVYVPFLEKYVQILCLVPTTINGIILATSVLGTYAGSGTLLANRIVMLIFVYCIFCLPLGYQGIRNTLYAIRMNNILEAAQMLGAGKFETYLKVIVPAALPGICNSALISFAGLFGDFAIIKIIASSQYETVQTYLYNNRNVDIQSFSAGVVIVLLLTLLINIAVHKSGAKSQMMAQKN